MNNQIIVKHNRRGAQLRNLFILFFLAIFILSPVQAEKWKTTKFKIIQESPKIDSSLIDNINNNLWFNSAIAKFTTIKINQDLIDRLERHLEKVAKKYEKMGFKSPDLIYEGSKFIIYGYNYSDKKASASNGCVFLRGKSTCILTFDLSRATSTKFAVQLTSKIFEDLAHELFHAVQESYSLFKTHNDLGDWIVEGTAEAMGIEVGNNTVGSTGGELLVRWGGRHYHTSLRVSDDNKNRRNDGYWTASLWRYIGEYISSNGSAGVKQKQRPDYSYLAKLFERNITGKTNENKELSWLDSFLKSNESNIGQGLGYIYPKFITTFAYYLPARGGKGQTKHWQKCLFTNINCAISNIIKAEPACQTLELSDDRVESVSSKIKFKKVSARCIKVSYNGAADKLDIVIHMESNDASTIESLRAIGMRTNPINKLKKIKVLISSSGSSPNGKHFSEWTFQNVNFRSTKRNGNKSVIFVISNVAEKASKTHKNPEVSFSIKYAKTIVNLTTSDNQGG